MTDFTLSDALGGTGALLFLLFIILTIVVGIVTTYQLDHHEKVALWTKFAWGGIAFLFSLTWVLWISALFVGLGEAQGL